MAACRAPVARESFCFATPLHILQLHHQLAASLLLLLLLLLHPSAITGAISTPGIFQASPHLHTNIAAALGSHEGLVYQTSGDLLSCSLTKTIIPPSSYAPPERVVIATPTDNGTYPVILFKHGFALANCFYTELFESLAASGYIVVAPQAVMPDPNCTGEIEKTAEVANWVSKNLSVVLNAALSGANVVPDTSQMVMAGHSRGGKIAFAVALGKASKEVPRFSALIALDPVDGTSSDSILDPPIVAAGCSHTGNQLLIPVLILGTGYGSETSLLQPLACAPACCGHMAYFNCSSAPIMYHLVAADYGHLDFLDSSQIWTGLMCKGGSWKAPLRSFTAELMLAFLGSALAGAQEGMESIIENWESAAITLEEPLVYINKAEDHRARVYRSAEARASAANDKL